MPAKCLTLSERSESASLCYYLQQMGKPVGNPGASGKLGVVGRNFPEPWGWAGRPGLGPASCVPFLRARRASLQPPQLSHCGLAGRWPYLKTCLPLESPRPTRPATANLHQVPPAVLEKLPGSHRFGVLRKEGTSFQAVWRYPGSPLPRKVSLCLQALFLSFHQ